MFDIFNIIPSKKKKSVSGWTSFNAVCCDHRGHRKDTRGRGGIRLIEDEGWVYSCFNCHYKCSYRPGNHFSKNLKQLLSWCGVDSNQIDKWSFESFQKRSILDPSSQAFRPFVVSFQDRELPHHAERLDSANPEHKIHIEYLRDRGLDPFEYTYYCSPEETGRNANRIIIPYYYEDRIVGYTSRFYDNRVPKYISEQQKGYIFNIDNQRSDWQVCILVEGQFDALSIGGCAYMGSTINHEQAQLLNRLHKNIIVVPDRDEAGLGICDRALELGYSISIPPWNSDIKDVNDAVKRYGRLPTLLSILQHATKSKIKVDVMKRKYK
jgi:hypothetical protein